MKLSQRIWKITCLIAKEIWNDSGFQAFLALICFFLFFGTLMVLGVAAVYYFGFHLEIFRRIGESSWWFPIRFYLVIGLGALFYFGPGYLIVFGLPWLIDKMIKWTKSSEPVCLTV